MPAGAHAVLLLAAGLSRRLGQPKQLLRRNSETLLQRTARLGLQTAPAQLLVVLPAGHPAMDAALKDLPHLALFNPAAETGLAGSLRLAAPMLQPYPQVLVLVCDQPALQEHHLHALLRGAAHASAGCAATDHAGRPGVPAVVPGAWFLQGGQDAPASDAGFRARLRALPPDQVWTLHAAELQHDLDTPEDVRRARAAGWLDAAGT